MASSTIPFAAFLLAVRSLIEPSAAAQAATVGDAGTITRLQAHVADQADAVDDLGRALGEVRLSHLSLAEITANGKLVI